MMVHGQNTAVAERAMMCARRLGILAVATPTSPALHEDEFIQNQIHERNTIKTNKCTSHRMRPTQTPMQGYDHNTQNKDEFILDEHNQTNSQHTRQRATTLHEIRNAHDKATRLIQQAKPHLALVWRGLLFL
jgi:hypothetical protein